MDKQGQFKQPDQPSSFNQQSYRQPYWGQQPAQYVPPQQPQYPLPGTSYPQPLPQSSQWQAQAAFPAQMVSPLPLPRSITRRTFKIMLYFTGVFIAIFGTFAVAVSVFNKNDLGESIGMIFGVVAAAVSIFIFFQKKYHIHCLSWAQYLWWTLGATLTAFIAFVVVFAVSNPNANWIANTIACSFLLFYGIIFIWIAHMKPSLPQQVNESVYRILKAVPGKQLVISELLARLQKEYKQLQSTTLHQYIARLDYIEQMNIPGTPVTVCRIKELKKVVAPPQRAVVPPQPLPTQAPSASPPNQATAPNSPAVQSVPPPSLRPQETFVPPPTQSMTMNSKSNEALPRQVQSSAAHTAKPAEVRGSLPHQSTPSAPRSIPVQSPAPLKPNVPKPTTSATEEQRIVKIFCCYVHEDEQLLMKLKAHLKPQQRQGLIHIWYDRDISAGAEWEREIDEQLNSAHIILLLVSSDFMASDYCYTKEMQRALDRNKQGEARTIPIILRPTDWQETPLGKLQALPKDGKPITLWANRDNAFLDVARGIRSVVESFLSPPKQGKAQVQTSNNHQQTAAEIETIRARCKQGKLIVTNKKIVVELSALGQVLKSQTLLRTSLTSIDSKLAVAPVFGMGGGVNLTFHGKGRELLQADLVSPKEAQEIIASLS